MKRKGFTLIELLAVIVVLAILALIAVPVVINMINKANKEALKRSAESYIKAVENAISLEELKDKGFDILDGTYQIMSNGDICIGVYKNNTCTEKELQIEVKNQKPTSGEIIVNNLLIEEYHIMFNEKYVSNIKQTDGSCFEVSENKDEITILDFKCNKDGIKDVIIPKMINGKKVTTIKGNAFKFKKLTSVVIPNSVTNIGLLSFYGNNLTSVTIPESVTSIESQAFRNNPLTRVTLSSGLKKIGSLAFADNSLTSITIPSSVTSIITNAFANNKLTSVIIQGKSSISDFTDYPTASPFGWIDGYDDSNIIWEP